MTSTLLASYGRSWHGNSGAVTGDHFVLDDAERCSGAAGELVLNDQGGSVMGVSYGVTGTLRAQEHGHQPIVCYGVDTYGPQGSGVNEDVSFTLNTVDRHAVCYGISSYASNAMKSSNPHSGVYVASTARTIDQNGGNPACNQGGIAVVEPVYSLDRACFNQGINAKYGMSIEENTAQTLVARGPSAVASPEQKHIVRRLTPLECERLQGYPDGWTALDHEDKAVSDTQRYKALGNSFAVPNALFVISRCVKKLREEQIGGTKQMGLDQC